MIDSHWREAAEADGVDTSQPCTYDGIHCWHWSYTPDACCHCGSTEDDEDSRCHPASICAECHPDSTNCLLCGRPTSEHAAGECPPPL